MEPVEIRTERLVLRPWRPEDAAAVLTACTDPATQRWTTVPVPYTAEHARDFVERYAVSGWEEDTDYSFAVCDAATGAVQGAVGLRRRVARDVFDVGYWATPLARGQGVVAEALSALCRWAFTIGAERVEWYAEVDNAASRRVAEKAGFTVEGVLRDGLPGRDGRRDCWIGARLPGDPEVDTRQVGR